MSSSIQVYPSLVLAQQMLTRYGYPCILAIGIVGNLFNILLFLRKTLRTTSCNNYFLASAFVNLVILNVGIITAIYTYDRPWAITTTYCKIRSYMLNATQQMSRFFIVTACFDRFALCSTSVRLRQFSRVHIARRYMIPSIIIIWLILPIHMLIYNTSVNNSCTYPGASALYNSIYAITLVGFIPPILMSFFSFLIFRNLKSMQQRRQVRQLAIVNIHLLTNENQRQQKKDQQVLGMLIVQVVVYVTTTTVTSINLLYSVLPMYFKTNKSNEQKSIEIFVSFITGMLNYSCPCLSFYLFILASHLYRKETKLVILYICRGCYLPWTTNNNNVDENISIRKNIARITPIQQPIMMPLSVINN